MKRISLCDWFVLGACAAAMLFARPARAQWQPVVDPSGGAKLHSFVASGASLYLGGVGHVWRSTDSGATWQDMSAGLPANGVVAIGTAPDGSLVCGTVKGAVAAAAYHWTGSTWRQAAFYKLIGTTLTKITDPIANLKISGFCTAYGKLFCCSAFQGEVWVSGDNGDSYSLYATNDLVRVVGSAAGALWTIGTTPDGVLAVSGEQGNGVWADPGKPGAAWTALGPPDGSFDRNCKQWLYTHAGMLYASRRQPSTGAYLERLNNGSWETAAKGLVPWQVVTALAEDSGGVLWESQQDTSGVGAVYKSTDGVSWSKVSDGVAAGFAVAPGRLYMLGSAGISWTDTTAVPPPAPVPAPVPVPVPAPVPQPVPTKVTGEFHVHNQLEFDALPWANLGPNCHIYLHAPATYVAKIAVTSDGEIIEGVPASDGSLPVIDCSGAMVGGKLRADHLAMFSGLAGILIGPATGDPLFSYKGYVGTRATIRNIEIVHAVNGVYFWQTAGTVVENCVIHDCTQGIFASGNAVNRFPVIRGNEIYKVGLAGSWRYHGAYIEASNPLVENNYVHDLNPGMVGSCWKDRSAHLVFRGNNLGKLTIKDDAGNYTHSSGARSLDDVNPQESREWMVKEPGWGEDLVEGNTFYQSNLGGYKLIHHGGENEHEYDRQHLVFRGNTVTAAIDSKKYNSLVMFECTTNDQKVDALGNTLTVTSFTPLLKAASPCWLQTFGSLTLGANTMPTMRSFQKPAATGGGTITAN